MEKDERSFPSPDGVAPNLTKGPSVRRHKKPKELEGVNKGRKRILHTKRGGRRRGTYGSGWGVEGIFFVRVEFLVKGVP